MASYFSLVPRVHHSEINSPITTFKTDGWNTSETVIKAINERAIRSQLVKEDVFVSAPHLRVVQDPSSTAQTDTYLELRGSPSQTSNTSAFPATTAVISTVFSTLTSQPFKTSGHLGERAYLNRLRNEYNSRLMFAQFPNPGDSLGVPSTLGHLCVILRAPGDITIEVHVTLDNGEQRVVILSSRCHEPRFSDSALTIPLHMHHGEWSVLWVDLTKIVADAFDVAENTRSNAQPEAEPSPLRALARGEEIHAATKTNTKNRSLLVTNEDPQKTFVPARMASTERVFLHGDCDVLRFFLTDCVQANDELPKSLQVSLTE